MVPRTDLLPLLGGPCETEGREAVALQPETVSRCRRGSGAAYVHPTGGEMTLDLRELRAQRVDRIYKSREALIQAAREAAKHPCADARGVNGWSCQTHDGTGLWCFSCLARVALVLVDGR